MKRRRPFGVTAIAVLLTMSALLTGLALFVARSGLVDPDEVEVSVTVTGAVDAALGLVIAVGLWQLRRWAWVATMLWLGSNMVGGLAAYVRGEPNYATMVLNILMVLYLNQRDVQHAFREQADAGDGV